MKSQQQASPAKGRALFSFPRATLVPCQARLEKVDAFTQAVQLASLDHSSLAEVPKGRRGEKSKLKLGQPIMAKVTNVTLELLSRVALAQGVAYGKEQEEEEEGGRRKGEGGRRKNRPNTD